MEEQTTTTEAPPLADRSFELTRSSTDRVLGGVATGIARRTGMPVWFVRALFIVFTFAGGLGVAVYAAGWFLIRAENEQDTIAERFFARSTSSGTWIGIALIFVAALILLDNVTFLSGGVIWAVGLLVVGVLLYSGDLPRLVKSTDDKEGVQQMTTPTSTVEVSVNDVADDSGGGDGATTPPPPSPTPTPPILPPSKHRSPESSPLGRLTFGVMLIALAGLAVLDNTTSLVSPEPRHYVALGVTVLGIGLLVGTIAGRARWLILVGILALPVLFTSPALEYDFAEWDTNTVFVAPTDIDQLPPTYTQGLGELVIDLTELDWSGQNVSLDASLQIGQLRIIIPENITVTGTAEGSIGLVEFDGNESSGLNPDLGLSAEGSAGTLDLNASIGIGHLEIDRVPVNG